MLWKFFYVFLIVVIPIYAAFTHAQATATCGTNGKSQTTLVCTLTNNPVSGDIVPIGFVWSNGTSSGPASVTISDGNSNSYTVSAHSPSTTQAATRGAVYLFYVLSAPANASKTITATFSTTGSGSIHFATMCVDDFTVTGATPTLNLDSTGTGTTGTTINTPTVTANSGNLAYAMANGNVITTVNSPWTGTTTATIGAGCGYILSATGNTALSMTQTTGAWDSMGGSFNQITALTRTASDTTLSAETVARLFVSLRTDSLTAFSSEITSRLASFPRTDAATTFSAESLTTGRHITVLPADTGVSSEILTTGRTLTVLPSDSGLSGESLVRSAIAFLRTDAVTPLSSVSLGRVLSAFRIEARTTLSAEVLSTARTLSVFLTNTGLSSESAIRSAISFIRTDATTGLSTESPSRLLASLRSDSATPFTSETAARDALSLSRVNLLNTFSLEALTTGRTLTVLPTDIGLSSESAARDPFSLTRNNSASGLSSELTDRFMASLRTDALSTFSTETMDRAAVLLRTQAATSLSSESLARLADAYRLTSDGSLSESALRMLASLRVDSVTGLASVGLDRSPISFSRIDSLTAFSSVSPAPRSALFRLSTLNASVSPSVSAGNKQTYSADLSENLTVVAVLSRIALMLRGDSITSLSSETPQRSIALLRIENSTGFANEATLRRLDAFVSPSGTVAVSSSPNRSLRAGRIASEASLNSAIQSRSISLGRGVTSIGLSIESLLGSRGISRGSGVLFNIGNRLTASSAVWNPIISPGHSGTYTVQLKNGAYVVPPRNALYIIQLKDGTYAIPLRNGIYIMPKKDLVVIK